MVIALKKISKEHHQLTIEIKTNLKEGEHRLMLLADRLSERSTWKK